MRILATLLAVFFAWSVNMGTAMADDDHHHKYEKHEKKHDHDWKKHDDDEEDDDHDRRHERDDASHHDRHEAGRSDAPDTAAGQTDARGDHGGVGVNIDFSKWWPF